MAKALQMEYRKVADAAKVFIDRGMRVGKLWTTEAWQVDFNAGVLHATPGANEDKPWPRPASDRCDRCDIQTEGRQRWLGLPRVLD